MGAQERDYQIALTEIKNGRKKSHWMWYIFPQIKGLGLSQVSKYYAINDIEEAKNYLSHPILGRRLIEISNELLKLNTEDALSIFGSPDDIKLKSSMTLFSLVEKTNPVFQLVLDKYFKGEKDSQTMQIIKEAN